MKVNRWRNRINYAFQYIPFTWNTFFFGVLAWLAYKILYRPVTKDNLTDAQLPFVRLMIIFVAWLMLALIVLSLCSTFASWLYFLWLRRKNKASLHMHFYAEEKNGRKKQYLEASISKAIKPVLGFVKGRLFYDNDQLTGKFSLLSARRKKNSLLREAITGRSRISLPDIKEYQIKGNIVFFEDMFHLLSLPVFSAMSGDFYQSPKHLVNTADEVAPKKTDTMDIRIDQLRKVEGEYLNYKDFESGDDVRRIVWKVYAKNRDLVVRIPERLEPYASHLYFYASFYNTISTLGGSAYFSEMLNYYKSNVWSVYEALQQQEWKMKYIPDQDFTLAGQLSEQEKDERIVSNSLWQNKNSTRDYFSPKKGTVLVISSLIDPKDLAHILEESDTSVQIIYIQLSKIFHQYLGLTWLKNLFFIPAPDRLSKLKSKWLFSPVRRQILKNEQQIERLLK
jgi:hypothetical protein